MAQPAMSIVMPALNEQDNIEAAIATTLEAFDEFSIDGEVVVVDDGSTDRTPEIVGEYISRDARVRLVRHAKPEGIGGAFWDGVKNAIGTYVCLIPGDNETCPAEIMRYFHLMKDVDIVVPYVFYRKSRSPFRHILSRLYIMIVDATFHTTYKYTNGTVIYRRCILQDISYHDSSFFYQTDLLVRLARRDYLYAEVPYRIGKRAGGDSKAVTMKSLVRVMKGYIKLFVDVYFRDRRGRDLRLAPDSISARRYAESRGKPV